jgi:hypothetical protein
MLCWWIPLRNCLVGEELPVIPINNGNEPTIRSVMYINGCQVGEEGVVHGVFTHGV